MPGSTVSFGMVPKANYCTEWTSALSEGTGKDKIKERKRKKPHRWRESAFESGRGSFILVTVAGKEMEMVVTRVLGHTPEGTRR